MIRFTDVFFESRIQGVSCEFPEGRTTAVLGGSGSGKSTLLRLTNRLLLPTSGTIQATGKMGFVPQQLGLFPHWTVRRQIERFGGDARQLAAAVGLSENLLDRYPHQLSGGQQQRVALARALSGNPPTLLLDEPFSALDPILRRDLQQLVLGLQRTVVFVTHDVREALRVAGHFLFLREGRVIYEGADIQACTDQEVQAYFA
ncbi:ATP-binding cassette domain-containing protein, partial [Bryobacter aggregatus]|uniref:ATP-binding cassette domain-containing protein n=1 Tax=Bryobacter aggregatus TaxID=360054 RepID=UPI0004E1AA24